MMKEIFSNQTTDIISAFHKAPRDGTIKVRVAGDIGNASVIFILKNSVYGEAKTDLNVTNTSQAFDLSLDPSEEFAFQLTGSGGGTNVSIAFAY